MPILALCALALLPQDPALVFHLTGDIESDRAQVKAAGGELQGFAATESGIIGAGLRVVGLRPESTSRTARGSITDFELGTVFCWDFWVRPAAGYDFCWLTQDSVRLLGGGGSSDPAAPLPPQSIGLMNGGMFAGGWDLPDLEPADHQIMLNTGEWNHVALAVDFGTTMTMRLVINGEVESFVHPTEPDTYRRVGLGWLLEPVLSGLTYAENSLEFDEIRLYDRFVSTAELRDNFEWGLTRRLIERRVLDSGEPKILTTSLGLGDWKRGVQTQVVADENSIDWVPAQWTRDTPSFGPIPRTCHAVVSIGDGKLLMFGGELRDTHVGNMANGDDTWIYHIVEQRWERVGGGATDRRGREIATNPVWDLLKDAPPPAPPENFFSFGEITPEALASCWGVAPEPRCHQGMAFDPTTGNAFLLSGWANENEGNSSYPDAWTFDVKSMTWTQQATDQDVPPITDISPVFHEARNRFLFLTRDAVLSMDPAGGKLEQDTNPVFVDEQFAPIAPRTPVQAMTWYDPDSELVLRFGGFQITPPEGERTAPLMDRTNSMMVYSAEHSAWVLRNTPDVAPSARVRGAVAYDTKRDYSVLFGGITGGLDSRTNDLWMYETSSNRWTELRAAGGPSGMPGPRGGYFGMAYDEPLDVFVVPFGRQDTTTFLDEVWRLALRPEASGTATYTFRRAGYRGTGPGPADEPLPDTWPEGLRLDWDWTGDVEPTFEVRVCEDGVDYGPWQDVLEEAGNGGGEVPGGLYIQVRITLPPGSRVTRLGFVD